MRKFILLTVMCLSVGISGWGQESGTTGNLSWELDAEGTLTISGTGTMWDYSYPFYAPWYDYRQTINGSQNTINANIPVTPNSIYEFVFHIHLKVDNPLSVTAYHNSNWQLIQTVHNYDYHNCELVVSDGSYILYTITEKMPWTIADISITDITYIGEGNLTSINAPALQTQTTVYSSGNDIVIARVMGKTLVG